MKQYHSVYSPRFPFVVVLLCVLLSLDTTLGSSNHEDLSREEQDQGGRTIEVSSSSSNGSSSDGTSRKTVTRKATKKTTAPSTPTPTLQMFLERYPEVKDRSTEEQAHLYMVYKLHLDGATSKELEKYKSNAFNFWNCCKDGNSATSTGCLVTYKPGVPGRPLPPPDQCIQMWNTCDNNPNGCCAGLSCQWRDNYNACLPDPDGPAPTKEPTNQPTLPGGPSVCGASPSAKPYGINTECYWEISFFAAACCQHWPDNRVGNKGFPWEKCA